MAEVKLKITPQIGQFLATTISQAGGNEVYFLARVAWKGPDEAFIDEVDVLARGNPGAAPAIIQRAEEWDIAIHNHPSGDLSPSEADLEVAGELGNREVGFAIIDNRAERLYLVVPPFERIPVQLVDPAEVAEIFQEKGPLRRELGDYEVRPGQVAMAREVAEALNEDRVVAIEAGTGVGKSFAYLIPAILWAVRNKKRVIVSTNTINLQEQLVGKDLPFLEQVLPVKFRFALIKGRGNYACKRKLQELEQEGHLLSENEDENLQYRDLVAWAKTAREGGLVELGAPVPEKIWERVMSETDKSLKVNCKFYQECFYYRAKRAASQADIVVVNHYLFFADLAVRRQTGNYHWDLVIPGYERVIFDEAHHLEDVASQYLGVRFAQLGIRNRFGRLISKKDPRKGVLPYLANRLRKEGAQVAADVIERGLLQAVPRAAARVEEKFEELLSLVERETRRKAGIGEDGPEKEPEPELHVRLTSDPEEAPFRKSLEEGLRFIVEEILFVLRHCERAVDVLEETVMIPSERQASLLLEVTSLRGRLDALCQDIEFFLDLEDQTHVRWAEIRGRRNSDRWGVNFATAPIRVAEDFKAAVYDPVRTVVMTSATLSVEGNVKFLGDRLGFNQVNPERFRFSEHPSPFDFQTQVLTLVPEDFPDPGSREYSSRVAEAVLSILLETGGRAFVLFTSYSLLRRTFDALEGRLGEEGIRALRQGETGRSELLRRFRTGPRNALFGTDSFWEGVDVKGEALECVIITRLPFRVPSEPVQVARIEDLRERGLNPFGSFTVPQAVLKFKQGFGRLIRSTKDRGVVVVLDRRIVTKRYGRSFLRSLPPTRFIQAPTAEILRQLGEFFRKGALERTIAGEKEALEVPNDR